MATGRSGCFRADDGGRNVGVDGLDVDGCVTDEG